MRLIRARHHGVFFVFMAKKKEKTEKTQNIKLSTKDYTKLQEEVEANREQSRRYMKTLWDASDEKMELLVGKTVDDQSRVTKSQVHDPRLSTIVLDRSNRVMAQMHVGHSYAESKDDIGKNKFMDLLLGHFDRVDDKQFSTLLKLRLMDLYSLVIGTQFGIVPWRVDTTRDYIGPALELLNFKDSFPQPFVTLNDAEHFGVRSYVTLNWLEKQSPDVWVNLDQVVAEFKDGGGATRGTDQDKTDAVERLAHPDTIMGTKKNPMIELYTEYRRDKWVTMVMRDIRNDSTNSHVVRVVENPYPEGMLPIVAKHAIPLLNRAVGLGEFERNMSLEKAKDSLINLYLDTVKMGLYPPLQINRDGVQDWSSLQYGAATRWFVDRPNVDIQATQISPQGLNTFNSTYGFLIAALQSSTGGSNTTDSDKVKSSLGKTPQAIRLLETHQNARDKFDRDMMDQAIEDIYKRKAALIANKLESPVYVRLFGKELQEIAEKYEDVTEVFDSGNGRVKIDPEVFRKSEVGEEGKKKKKPIKYDYRVESGSTMQKNTEAETQSANELLQLALNGAQLDPQTGGVTSPLIQAVRSEGKDLRVGELFERLVSASGITDWDKIIVDQEKAVDNTVQGQEPQMPLQQYNDPEIQQVADQLFRQ